MIEMKRTNLNRIIYLNDGGFEIIAFLKRQATPSTTEKENRRNKHSNAHHPSFRSVAAIRSYFDSNERKKNRFMNVDFVYCLIYSIDIGKKRSCINKSLSFSVDAQQNKFLHTTWGDCDRNNNMFTQRQKQTHQRRICYFPYRTQPAS